QSANGLRYDIEKCLNEFRTTGNIKSFKLGKNDLSGKFEIPQKLYGREKEIEELMQIFERTCVGNMELVLVSGHSGIGKSALINEIHAPVVKNNGLFIHGKFEQLERHFPYFAMLQAFRQLVNEMLTGSEKQLKEWKNRILGALRSNGQLIIDVLPELELVIGKQPEVDELPPIESQNRFNITLQNFVRALATKERPLVMFIDDLQWADPASLLFLQLLITQFRLPYLLIIGAYREDELDENHPLLKAVNKVEESGVKVNRISISALNNAAINDLLSDTLEQEEKFTQPLTEVVQRITAGNPFFINQYLESLVNQKLLVFDHKLNTWQYDLKKIQALDISDDAVDLMIEKINTCSKNTRESLSIAAAIGNRFDLKYLSIVFRKTQHETVGWLVEAIEKGIIQPLDNNYKIILKTNDDSIELPECTFKFGHDKMQQSAYAIVDQEKKLKLHYQIGQVYKSSFTAEEKQSRVFDIVNQLNSCIELIETGEETQELVLLNIEAAHKAKASNAYNTALGYFGYSIDLIDKDSWLKLPDQTRDLYMSAGECAYLISDFDKAEELFNTTLDHSETNLEKAQVYSSFLIMYNNESKLEDAWRVGIKGLGLLDVKFSTNPGKVTLLIEIIKISIKLRGKKLKDLLAKPDMKKEEPKLALFLMMQLLSFAFNKSPELLATLIVKGFALTLKYGNAPTSYFGYAGYGTILGIAFGKIDKGWEFIKAGGEIAQKYNSIFYQGRGKYAINGNYIHRVRPLKQSLPELEESFQLGIEGGDFINAGYVTLSITEHSHVMGTHLEKVLEKSKEGLDFSKKIKFDDLILFHQGLQSCLAKLIGEERLSELDINITPESQFIDALNRSAFVHVRVVFNLLKLQANYILENYESIVEQIEIIEKEAYALVPTAMEGEFILYKSLAYCAIYEQASSKDKKRFIKSIRKGIKTLKKFYATAPENYLHKFHLLSGEYERLMDHKPAAIENYKMAITSARENGYTQIEAIANELYGKYSLEKDDMEYARIHLLAAYKGYEQWGAKQKSALLKEKYASSIEAPLSGASEIKQGELTGEVSKRIDLVTLMKASNAISEQISLDSLLNKLMYIVIENAGAEKGFLIMQKQNDLYIAASGSAHDGSVSINQQIKLEQSEDLAISVVNYVSRTQKALVIHDAANDDNYMNDPYVAKHKPKSIICTPFLKHGELTGLVYLENNVSTGVFTPERLELLNLLSSQAAISLENAKLYDELEERVEERTIELKQEIEVRKTAEQALEQANSDLGSANKDLDDFAYIISHDLKAPLRGISSISEWLVEDYVDKLDEAGKDQLKTLKERVGRMDDLITGVLNYTRAGREKVEKKDLDLNKVVQNMIDLLAAPDHIKITIKNKLPNYKGDQTQIQQVFQNIIGNAIKYNDKEKGVIEIDCVEEESHYKFNITDNGPGIKEKDKERIFNIFQMVDSSKKDGSTGVGLTIVKKIVELYGGKIWIESEYGKGSSFLFTFEKFKDN
ncbi:MAG: AAA family ATPase, partial [Bacteroidetes bacterium]|nr:AAA family ATPase [Bacteroidota bacterium]